MMMPLALLTIEDDDDRAFMTQLYEKYSGLMYRVAYDCVRDYSDAQDIVNDVVVKLIDKIPLLREKESCVLRSYVVSAIRRTSLNALKKRGRKALLDDDALADMPDDRATVEADAIARASQADIAAALDKLPERERHLLRWKYFEEYTDEEIAALLGIGKDSVRAYLTKARRHMRALLERQGIHDAG